MPKNQQDNLKLAVFSVIFAVLALSFGDAVIKLVSVSFPLWQIYVIRSLLAMPVLIAIIKFSEPGLSFIPISIKWTVIRSLLLGLMWVAYYSSLPHIKLSVAAAVYYTIPLFITLFSAWFTGDKVSLKSWFAIVLGFVGVLIIVRPDAEGFNGYVLLPLAAAIFYSLAMILTRTKCLDENPKILSLSLNLMFVAMGIVATLIIQLWQPGDEVIAANPFLLGEWTVLESKEWLAMGILAVIVIIGSVFAAIAYQKGPSSVVATFDYSYLAFSAMWGFLIFAEVPDAFTILGMILITCAGMIAIRR